MEDEKSNCEGFRCPEFLSESAEDDQFFIPKDCCGNEKIPQPKFPSPNSCLTEEELKEVEERIARANELLLDIALSNTREDNEVFQKAFDGVQGQSVKIEIDCISKENPEQSATFSGVVMVVGFDFVVLKTKEGFEAIIPFEKIKHIKLSGKFAEKQEEKRLINIDPIFRRKLTYHFGRTVSSSPQLIQIFFRLRIKIYMMLLIEEKVKVNVEGDTMEGIVFDVHNESFTLKIREKIREIPIEKLCYIVVIKESNEKKI
ncbi:hypothetical protein CIB95_09815 [Lottiidibacillus patelloidae]|uniref:Uncharacterized protein n=2 Tax=Lottiidibacillus patelloidae TaxID=2670334 RepID=A0A263BU35_9BACI|nr:hypothetical protein CIB95_09815 [Lottiidibacillus patelloidae]